MIVRLARRRIVKEAAKLRHKNNIHAVFMAALLLAVMNGWEEKGELMNITVAKSAGFCFGVKRAVNKVYEQTDISNGPIYNY